MTTAEIESVQAGSAQAIVFQALGCVQGTYIPLSLNCLQGTLTTPDRVQFSATLRSSVRGYLKHKFGVLEPGKPVQPDGEILWWKVYPKVVDDSLHLELMLLVAESYRLPPDEFTITGLLTQQDEQEQKVSIRIYRNTPGDKYHPSLSPQFFPLQLMGYLPDLKVGQLVQLSARREGTKLTITEAREVTINLDERVRRDIEQSLNPRKPLPPPVKRPLTEATQPEVVQSEMVGVQDAEVSMLTQAQSVVILQQPLEPSELVSNPETSNEVPPAHKAPPKRKQAAPSVIMPVEPELVEVPQPEPSTIPVPGGSTNALNPQPESPAVPAAKSTKKKQQATAPTPVTTVLTEKKSEAAIPLKPNFVVQVDRRQFPGMTSVTLKTGMLFIDGKQVVRTKLAIVVGEPQEVSADGRTQKSGNQTILSSR